MRSQLVGAALTGLLVASVVSAETLYLTARRGDVSLSRTYGTFWTQTVSGDGASTSLGLGWRPSRFLAVEAEYHDLGEVGGSGSPCVDRTVACIAIVVPVEGESKATSLALVPQVSLTDRWRLFGRLGVTSWETDVWEMRDGRRGPHLGRYEGEDTLIGVGVRYRVYGPLAVLADYTRLSDSFEGLSLGASVGW